MISKNVYLRQINNPEDAGRPAGETVCLGGVIVSKRARSTLRQWEKGHPGRKHISDLDAGDRVYVELKYDDDDINALPDLKSVGQDKKHMVEFILSQSNFLSS